MKKIGIIGGLGPESTAEYYTGIIKAFAKDYDKTGFPEIAIESLNLKECLNYAATDNWEQLTKVIVKACNNLKSSGAEFGAIASNTPHRVFHDISAQTPLPLISIVDETQQIAANKHLKKLILLGTKFTMSSNFYPESFNKAGISLVTPIENDQDYVQDKIFRELQLGVINPETKERFLSIIEALKMDTQAEGVILACTELPLIIKPDDIDIEYIDPTQIHIDAIVKACLKK